MMYNWIELKLFVIYDSSYSRWFSNKFTRSKKDRIFDSSTYTQKAIFLVILFIVLVTWIGTYQIRGVYDCEFRNIGILFEVRTNQTRFIVAICK